MASDDSSNAEISSADNVCTFSNLFDGYGSLISLYILSTNALFMTGLLRVTYIANSDLRFHYLLHLDLRNVKSEKKNTQMSFHLSITGIQRSRNI